jgi:hypothetical protein
MNLHPILITIWKCSNIYILWIGIHYASAHLYPYFCADLSLAGLVTSPFLAMAPHCRAIAWLQKTSTTVIENMWVLLGTWTAAQLIPNPKMLQTADNAS